MVQEKKKQKQQSHKPVRYVYRKVILQHFLADLTAVDTVKQCHSL